MEIIKAENVGYVYKTKYQKIEAVKNMTCSFETGKIYSIVGEFGSGKSTFLSLLAGLDLPSSGALYIQGEDIRSIDRDKYRMDRRINTSSTTPP